jgi:sugar phosphate isomerase/epimerase
MVLPQAALTGPLELTKLKGKAIHVHISDCDGTVHGDLTSWPRRDQIRALSSGDQRTGHQLHRLYRARIFA